jgi:gamma-glutamyltranspeptidase/glutathione hydrolase
MASPLVSIGTLPAPPHDVVAAGGLSSSSHPWASAAGADMLVKGGNAVDAAVASAFTLAVCEPAFSHLGGDGAMLVHLSDPGETVAVEFSACAPGAAGAGTVAADGRPAGLAVAIPGAVCGWVAAHRRWGQLPLTTVARPALQACDGVPLSRAMAAGIAAARERLAAQPAAAAVFLRPDGSPRAEGDTIDQPMLAAAIDRVASDGYEAMYDGPLGRDLVAHVRAHGGVLTMDDLRRYPERLLWVRTPDAVSFAGHVVEGAAPAASAFLLHLLRLLDGIGIGAFEPLSVERLHLLAEATKLAVADHGLHAGDHTHVNVPLAGLLDARYAAERRLLIRPEIAGFPRPGDPWRFQQEPPDPHRFTAGDEAGSGGGGVGSHHSHVDRWGNAVAMTQSLGHAFGSGLFVPRWGVLLNDAMRLFDPRPGRAASVRPYQRPRMPWPTIVRGDGGALMALGASSGPAGPTAITQVLLNVLDDGLGLRQAVGLPRIHWNGEALEVEDDLPAATMEALAKRGHRLHVRPARSPSFGAVQVVWRDPETGLCRGAADPRREGAVVAASMS